MRCVLPPGGHARRPLTALAFCRQRHDGCGEEGGHSSRRSRGCQRVLPGGKRARSHAQHARVRLHIRTATRVGVAGCRAGPRVRWLQRLRAHAAQRSREARLTLDGTAGGDHAQSAPPVSVPLHGRVRRPPLPVVGPGLRARAPTEAPASRGSLSIVTEFVPRGSLFELLQDRASPLTWCGRPRGPAAVSLARSLALGGARCPWRWTLRRP
jgi:hypothetical protein